MASLVFPIMRVGTLAFWLVVLLCMLNVFPSPWNLWGLVLGGVVLAAHIVELAIFRQFILDYSPKSKAILNILVYGVFWLLPEKNGKHPV